MNINRMLIVGALILSSTYDAHAEAHRFLFPESSDELFTSLKKSRNTDFNKKEVTILLQNMATKLAGRKVTSDGLKILLDTEAAKRSLPRFGNNKRMQKELYARLTGSAKRISGKKEKTKKKK